MLGLCRTTRRVVDDLTDGIETEMVLRDGAGATSQFFMLVVEDLGASETTTIILETLGEDGS